MSRSAQLPRFGIVGRLAAAAVGVGLVAAALGAAAIGLWASDALEGQVEELNLGIAMRLAISVDDSVNSAASTMSIAATRRALMAPEGQESPVSELYTVLTNTVQFETLQLLDREGVTVAAAANRFLPRIEEYPPRPDVMTNLSDSGRHALVVSGTSLLEIAVPVEDPPGTIVGALLATVPLEIMASRVDELRVGRSGRARLVDAFGVTLVHPDRDRVVRRERIPIDDLLGEGQEPTATIERNGRALLVAAAPTTTFDGAVTIEQPRSDALAPVGTSRTQLIAILLLIVGVTVLAVIAAGRWLLRPVRPLAESVQRYGAGDPVRFGPAVRDDELGMLAVQFDRMADALDDRLAELRETNEQLREAQERLDDAFINAPIGMAVMGLEGDLIGVNPAFARMLGREPSEVNGTSLLSHLHPEELEATQEDLERIRSSVGRGAAGERRFITADGNDGWSLLTMTALTNRLGDPISIMCQAQNITARKQAEHELIRLDRAKTEFVANAAHELRTPLTALAGLAELLADGWRSMEQEAIDQSLEALVRQGARTRILVQKMLNLLRIESGSQRLNPRPVDLRAAVASAIGSLPRLSDRAVDVDIPERLEAIADPVALEQMLVNLLTNAAVHGGPSISVTGARDQEHCVLLVCDDGDGVETDLVSHLFEPFARGTQRPGEEGTGLGLAIVRRLAESQGGSVSYEPRDPHGSRFTIRLPVL